MMVPKHAIKQFWFDRRLEYEHFCLTPISKKISLHATLLVDSCDFVWNLCVIVRKKVSKYYGSVEFCDFFEEFHVFRWR